MENLRDEAILHAWKLLLSDERFDPEHVEADGRPAGPLIKEAMNNKVLDLKRRRDLSTRNPDTGQFTVRTRVELPDLSSDSSDESPDGSHLLFPSANAAEDEALAHSEIDAVFAIFRECIEDLAAKPDQQFVIGEWLRRQVGGRELNQTGLAQLVQRERQRRNDGSAHKAPPHQTTIARWINSSREALTEMLADPKRGIDPSYRNAALTLIAPNKHADTTAPPEATK